VGSKEILGCESGMVARGEGYTGPPLQRRRQEGFLTSFGMTPCFYFPRLRGRVIRVTSRGDRRHGLRRRSDDTLCAGVEIVAELSSRKEPLMSATNLLMVMAGVAVWVAAVYALWRWHPDARKRP
jgi:hypothetical protein